MTSTDKKEDSLINRVYYVEICFILVSSADSRNLANRGFN
jgi:hypothetical protein